VPSRRAAIFLLIERDLRGRRSNILGSAGGCCL
jgi:hypothetical protein